MEERPWLALGILLGLFATSAVFWERGPGSLPDRPIAVTSQAVWAPALVPAVSRSPRALQATRDMDLRLVRTSTRSLRAKRSPAPPAPRAEGDASETMTRVAVLDTASLPIWQGWGTPAPTPAAPIARRETVLPSSSAIAAIAPRPSAVADSVPAAEEAGWPDDAAAATSRAFSTAGRAIGRAFRIAVGGGGGGGGGGGQTPW